jgi:hypothetical protein
MKNEGYNSDSDWLKTSWRLTFKDIINYKVDRCEVFTEECIDLIIKYAKRLLDGKLRQKTDFDALEPDFSFLFVPKKILYDDITKEPFIANFYMEIRVHLWHNGLTDNFISMTLWERDIIKFRDYLLDVKKE